MNQARPRNPANKYRSAVCFPRSRASGCLRNLRQDNRSLPVSSARSFPPQSPRPSPVQAQPHSWIRRKWRLPPQRLQYLPLLLRLLQRLLLLLCRPLLCRPLLFLLCPLLRCPLLLRDLLLRCPLLRLPLLRRPYLRLPL